MFEGIDNAYPLTPLQEGILYEVLKAQHTDVYVAYVVIDIHGQLDEQLFRQAWRNTLAQHDTLRTRFVWEGLDEPLQLVDSDVSLQWSRVDKNDGELIDDVVAQWLRNERQTPLALGENAPLRFKLIRCSSDHSVLIWTVHHLLADDWSTPVVLSAVMAHYSGLGVRTPALAYGDYVDWLASTDLSASRAWWQQQLADAEPTPIPFKRSVLEHRNDGQGQCHPRLKRLLDAETAEALSAFSMQAGVTQSSVFHAAWALTLSRFAGTERPVFGTSVSGRTCPLPAIDGAVGLFLNTLPTSVFINTGSSPVNFVQAVQSQLFEQLSNEHVPLSELQRMTRSAVPAALFESVLVVETHGTALDLASDGPNPIRFGTIRYETDSNYPLTILVFPGTTPEVHLLASTDYMDNAFLPVLADAFINTLKALCSDLSDDIATVLQAQQTQFKTCAPVVAAPARPEWTRIDEWITDTARKHPDAVALVHDDKQLTYDQLLNRAVLLANTIRQHGTAADCIGLYVGRSVDQIVGVLAILLSGKGYLALDVEWPIERIRMMMDAANVKLVLSRQSEQQAISGGPVSVLCVDAEPEKQAVEIQPSGVIATNEQTQANLAYLMFTSGSTGTPKAVPITHQNLLYSTAARVAHYPENPAAFLLLSSLAFDSSVAGVFWTLCCGGTLVLQNDIGHNDVDELVDLIANHNVSHTLCLPSVYTLMLQYGLADKLVSLNTVMVAGEACPDQLPNLHKSVLPTAGLYNEYGPTEATVWSTVACLHSPLMSTDSGQALSIGQPIPGTQVHIEGARGQVCPPGVLGEIIISGPGVVAGYRNDPASSAGSFAMAAYAQDHAGDVAWGDSRSYRSGDQGYTGLDGHLYFEGRIDDQIKIRGHRIEPAEITWRVESQDAVAQAYTLPIASDALSAQSTQLFCYVVLKDFALSGPCQLLLGEPVDEAMRPIVEKARRRISEELPSYFQVSEFVAINSLPRLPNGKVDKNGFPFPALKPLNIREGQGNTSTQSMADASARTPMDASREYSKTSTELCRLLAMLLGKTDITASDNFFSLGGDSLSAIRFVALCREHGVALNIPMITQHATLAQLADALDQQAVAENWNQERNQERNQNREQGADSRVATGSARAKMEAFGETPLSPIQRWFFMQDMPKPEQWNMGFLVSLEAPVDVEPLTAVIQDVVTSTQILGACFMKQDDQWVARVPEQPNITELVTHVSTPAHRDGWAAVLLEAQQNFDLSSGQLLKVVLGQDATDGRCRTLGVVIHHLVTDALSNRFLADRITNAATAMIAANPTLGGTPGTAHSIAETSYRDWASYVHKLAFDKSQRTDPSRSRPDSADITLLATPVTPASNTTSNALWTESRVRNYACEISAELLASLRLVCQQLDVEMHETLLFAIVQSMAAQATLSVDVEMHGRDLLTSDIDVSGSIGWFTSFFRLPVQDREPATLQAFSEGMRTSRKQGQLEFIEAPEHFVRSSASAVQSVDQDSVVPMLYNYLAGAHGDLSPDETNAQSFEPLLVDGLRYPGSPRSHPIDCIVLDSMPGQLEIRWRVDEEVAQLIDVPAWQASFMEQLHVLLADSEETITNNEVVVATDEDEFADSGLDADELERLLAGL